MTHRFRVGPCWEPSIIIVFDSNGEIDRVSPFCQPIRTVGRVVLRNGGAEMGRANVRRYLFGLSAAAAVAAAGCRTPSPVVRVFSPPPSAPAAPPGELPSTPLTLLEPDYATLPLVDPATADVTGITRPPPVGLTEVTCAKLAAANAALATALERENEVPSAKIEFPGSSSSCSGEDSGSLARELRPLVAADLRNKAAGEAVVAFYQLADAEGRGEVVRKTIESIDKLRAAVKEAKAKGVKPPIDEEELDRQRATWIGLLGQVELGAKLLDSELKRRLGASGKTADRFQPAGEFGISRESIDAEAAVKLALERRQDIVALRTAYLKISPDNVGEVRDFLRTVPGAGRLGTGSGPQLPLSSRIAQRKVAEVESALRSVAALEVEVRKQQLFVLIEQKERGVADEVRAEVAVLTEQARQVGLARWRAEKLMAKLAEVRQEDGGAAKVAPAELEANRARADVIQAVMGWHQAKAKLTAAQGLYTGEGK